MAGAYEEHGQREVAAAAWSMIYDRKFNVALRRTHGDLFMTGLESSSLSTDDALLVAVAMKLDPRFSIDVVRVNVNLFPQFYLNITTRAVRHNPGLQRVWTLVEHTITTQLAWLTEKWTYRDPPHLTRRVTSAIGNASRSAVVERLLAELGPLTDLVHTTGRRVRPQRETESRDEYFSNVGKNLHATLFRFRYPIVWSERACMIRYDKKWYYFAKPYILMMHNKLCDILSAVVYAAVTPYETYRWNLMQTTCDFLEAWAECAVELGQDFFRVSKLLEAVGIGMTLRDTEGEHNEQFLHTVRLGAREHIGLPLSAFRFYKIMDRAPIEVRHELMCLSKTMGHPFCDVEKGAADLKKKVTDVKELDPQCIRESVWRAKEDFVRHYYKRHRKWPLCDMSPETPVRVARIILHNLDPFSLETMRRYGGIPLEAYDYIQFRKLREFEWLENFIPYIKDRTISALRSDIMRVYFSETGETGRIPWQDTRLLLFYLMSPMSRLNHVKYMHAYVAGQWEMIQDYLIIRIVPKEKEHKVEARGFGCKPYEDRARTIVQEYNTAGILHDYSSEHVMTLDELGLAKKLLAFRSMAKAYRGYRMLILSVDASAWNNAFRGEAIHPIMEETLDRFYDVDLWSKTQTAYERSFIYVPDVERMYSWDGQAGGIEGLNQYTWVYAYIHQMKVCLRDQPYPYYILCKGDDLRVAVLVAPDYLEAISIDALKVELLESVASIGRKFGHSIKVEDSYASESYFAFSKDAYVEGAEQSQAMRKVQKCYGANNAFINILDEYVASAFSNAHSASKVAPSPVATYCVGVWWALVALLMDKRYKELADWELVACMLVPNILGGFPIIYLHNMFTRAESDLLPPFLDLCRYAQEHVPHLATILLRAWRQKLAPVHRCLSGLMMDIYSLPITKPSSATTILRREMSHMLQDRTQNEALQALFRAASRGMERNLLLAYQEANVYNVKLMSALFDCLPEAIIRELVRKFESGKSIYLALHRGRGFRRAQSIVRQAYKADARMHQFRIELLTRGVLKAVELLPADWAQRCPGEVCAEIRSQLWEKPIIGVTQPPPQHQIYGGWVDSIEPTYYTLRNHFELWHTHPSGDRPHLLSVGEYTPFVGSITGRGLSKPHVELKTQNIVSMKIHTLLDVYQWSRVCKSFEAHDMVGNLWQICESLIEDYTGRSIKAFLPYAGDTFINKTIQHHLRAHNYRASIVPNTLMNIYTTMKGNIYAHRIFKTSVDHYKMNYLQIMCHMISLTALPWWCGDGQKLTPRVWGVTTDCAWCLTPMEEEPVVLPDTDIGSVNLAGVLRVAPAEIERIVNEVDHSDVGPVYEPMATDDDTHLGLAKQGLCEYIAATTWSRKLVVQTATNHHMSATSAAILAAWHGDKLGVSLSVQDLVAIGCESLVDSIAHIVHYHIVVTYPTHDEVERMTAMASTPAEQHPWFTFLLTIESAMLIYDLQRFMRKKNLPCKLHDADSARGLTHQFGHFCYLYALTLGHPRDWIVLSYDREAPIPSGVRARLDAMRLDVMDRSLGRLLSQARRAENARHIIGITEYILTLALSDDEGFSVQVPEPGVEGRIGTLFPPIDNISDYLEGDMMGKDECDHESVDAPGMEMVESIYDPHGFTQVVIDRYRLGWVTCQVYFYRIFRDGSIYDRMRPEALKDMDPPGVTIYHLDPVTCLNTVKTHATSLGDVPEEIIVADETAHLQIVEVHGLSLALRCGRVESIRQAITLEGCPERDGPYRNPVLRRSALCRTIGVGNHSMSKAMSVFQQLQIAQLPERGLYACLGDGYGGYTAVVSAFTKNSRIVYNTMPLSAATPPYPMEAEAISMEHRNVFDTTHVIIDAYDLTSTLTVTAFCDHYKGVTLMTCDAENPKLTGGRYTATRAAIIRNVTTMFVRASRAGGILILKTYAFEYKLWLCAAQNLAPVCSQLHILYNRLSYNDGELYLVAQLVAPADTWTYDTVLYPPQVQCQRVERFFRRLLEVYEAPNPPFLRYEKLFSTYHCELMRRFPCYGWSKVVEITKIALPPIIMSPHRVSLDGWRRVALGLLDGVIRTHQTQYKTHALGHGAAVFDTLTHKVVLAGRAALLHAVRTVIDILTSELREITEQDLERECRTIVTDIAVSLNVEGKVQELMTQASTIGEIPVNLHADWEQGVRLGISIASYTLCQIEIDSESSEEDDILW
ncbi:polymerase [Wuhan louse fly virus 6]|uniref:RNA-directed RNA polymerase L n=1 Tax=Wuhan louse fly virus 6 TaxID=1608120 RepID=A0A0B5KJX3_9VIRU|nr:polymerase [Wuhan louse fly virus 6]AJG39070.1 polymerase [Wuhan louse fly virus 6]